MARVFLILTVSAAEIAAYVMAGVVLVTQLDAELFGVLELLRDTVTVEVSILPIQDLVIVVEVPNRWDSASSKVEND
jgi:hypothetical protein